MPLTKLLTTAFVMSLEGSCQECLLRRHGLGGAAHPPAQNAGRAGQPQLGGIGGGYLRHHLTRVESDRILLEESA